MNLVTENTYGMDDMQVPIETELTNEDLSDFNYDDPMFYWTVSPQSGQMSVDLLLVTLDQNRTDETADIPPPRGIGSVNTLAVEEATFTSESGKFSELIIFCVLPDFSFLPLELTSVENACQINYDSSDDVVVKITGFVTIENDQYSSEIIKYNDTDSYKIYLNGADSGALMTSSIIKNIIFPTISTETTSIFPTEDYLVNYLNTLGINEDTLEITLPELVVNFEPYLFYSVDGYLNTGKIFHQI